MSEIETFQHARWFGGKNRTIRAIRVRDRADWAPDASVCLADVEYVAGPPETYVLADRFEDPRVGRHLLRQFAAAPISTEQCGRVVFSPTHLLAEIPLDRTEPIAVMQGEQSNSSLRYGDALIFKLFRRFQIGPNPDVEIGRFLTEHTSFRGTPGVAGSVEYVTAGGEAGSLAMLQQFVPNRGDAWSTTLRHLAVVLAGADPTESIAALGRLGQTTAELHLALASGDTDAFRPEPISAQDTQLWHAAIEAEVLAARDALLAHGISVSAPHLIARIDGIHALRGSLKTRHHGDYHLGQVLERDAGTFMIIDFEGEPAKPLAVRREKRSPLRDVAGLLRSLDYAQHAALRAGGAEEQDPERAGRAADWHVRARAAFVESYLSTARANRPGLLPDDAPAALAALELEKGAYEVLYELNNRPDWLPIPLAALQA